ncbi:MAG: general secretion pathway protein GspK [Planctomycetes bacterium]|nr:general secretion pathway protein GspK [Planctomycetota bacterium]
MVVLFLLSVLLVIVFSFTYTTRVHWRLVRNRAADLQMTWLGKAGVEAAKALLESDAASNSYDWLGDKWADPFPPIFVEGAAVQVEIIDEDRKINLNNLVLDRNTASKADPETMRKPFKAQILRAVEAIDPRFSASALVDQVETRVSAADKQAVDPQDVPSLFIGRPFHSIEEVLEFQEKVEWTDLYGDRTNPDHPKLGLADLLTVINMGRVNVNTAPREVLKALHDRVTDAMAQAIVEQRKEREGFKSVDEINRVPGLPEPVILSLKPLLTVRSLVFSLTVEVQRGEIHRKIRCLLQRPYTPEEGTRPMPGLVSGLKSIRVLRWDEVREK